MSKKNIYFMSHANITQTVRMCYKIKICFRDLFGCFCGVLLRFLTLLFLKRACFPFQYSHYWKARVALLHDN